MTVHKPPTTPRQEHIVGRWLSGYREGVLAGTRLPVMPGVRLGVRRKDCALHKQSKRSASEVRSEIAGIVIDYPVTCRGFHG